MNEKDCSICGEKHAVDKYGWIQSCIGYFHADSLDHQKKLYMKEMKNKK